MFHDCLDYFQKASLGNRPNTKLESMTVQNLTMVDLLYRNTIAGSPPGERIFIFFEKIRFASQKLNFSIFHFLAKKSVK
jgi:hypothetical protein